MDGGEVGSASNSARLNLAEDNGQHGFYIETMNDGTVGYNLSRNNTANGFQFDEANGPSIITNNLAQGNQNGFEFTVLNGATITQNRAYENDLNGFYIDDLTASGQFSFNDAILNQNHGVHFSGDFFGSITNNNADLNVTGNGIFVEGLIEGNVTGNDADGNALNGIHLAGGITGAVSGNGIEGSNNRTEFISNNGEAGIRIDGEITGGVTGNRTSSNDTHGIMITENMLGNISANNSHNNALDGIHLADTAVLNGNISGNNTGGTPASGNQGNGRDGIRIAGQIVNDGQITGNIAHRNTGYGIHLTDTGSITGNVTNNQMGVAGTENTGNDAGGMYLHGDVTGTVSGNDAYRNGGHGIVVTNVTGDITGNTTGSNVSTSGGAGNAGDGLRIEGDVNGLVSGNTAHSNTGAGIRLAADGTITGNVQGNQAGVSSVDPNSSGNGQGGIVLDGDVFGHMLNNLAYRNSVGGIIINGAVNNVQGNTANYNTGGGIQLLTMTGSTVFSGNTTNNNLGANGHGVLIGTMDGGTLTNNSSYSNAQTGFYVEGAFIAGTIVDNRAGNLSTQGNGSDGFRFNSLSGTASVINNQSRFNGRDGYRVEGTYGDDALFSQNRAVDNTGNGFHFLGAVTGGTIGSGITTEGTVTGSNIATRNDLDGFRFVNVGGNVEITGNTATANDGDGFDIVAQTGGSFIGQRSFNNLQQGYRAPAGVPGVILTDIDVIVNATNTSLQNYQFFPRLSPPYQPRPGKFPGRCFCCVPSMFNSLRGAHPRSGLREYRKVNSQGVVVRRGRSKCGAFSKTFLRFRPCSRGRGGRSDY